MIHGLRSEPTGDANCSLAPKTNHCTQQRMGRRLLSIVFDGRVKVLELIVAEFGDDPFQQRQRRVWSAVRHAP